MVKTLDNETLGGPQQIAFLAYHKSKLSTEISPLSNRGYPVSGFFLHENLTEILPYIILILFFNQQIDI
jgi:hypothetical protein